MLVTMQLSFTSSDTSEAVGQTVEAFGAALAGACAREARFEKIGELAFRFGVAHPAQLDRGKGRASYSRGMDIFFTEDWLEYDAWIGDSWPDRVRAVARGTQAALARVHKTRLSPEERAAVSRAIEREAEALALAPPERLAALGPIYAYEDGSMGFQSPAAFAAVLGNRPYREVPPAEMRDFARQREEAQQPIETVKLYKREAEQLLYREAWVDGEAVVEHAGVYGQRGSVQTHPAAGPARQREAIAGLAAAAEADGFRRVPEDKLVGLVVSTAIDGMGSADDLKRRHALEDFLDEVTGWRGLGHCDGGSIGSGSMEAFCLVVDYAIAAEAIARELAASPFADFKVSPA